MQRGTERMLTMKTSSGRYAELEQARSRGGPVYVVCGYLKLNLADGDPDDPKSPASGARKVADETLFEELDSFPGIDPMFYFRVMRARDAS